MGFGPCEVFPTAFGSAVFPTGFRLHRRFFSGILEPCKVFSTAFGPTGVFPMGSGCTAAFRRAFGAVREFSARLSAAGGFVQRPRSRAAQRGFRAAGPGSIRRSAAPLFVCALLGAPLLCGFPSPEADILGRLLQFFRVF